MGEFFALELRELAKKSSLCAKSVDDLEKLKSIQLQFLNYEIKEDKETVCFYYDIENKNPFYELREEKRINQLRALLEIEKLEELFIEYKFSLNPENLYFDRNYRSYVKSRDFYEKGIEGDKQDFVAQYKALIGHVMQKKYSFLDYYAGGADLYKKNTFLRKLDEKNSIQEIVSFLLKEYERVKEITLHKRVEVNKSWYRLNKWCLVAAAGLIVVAAIYIAYVSLLLIPRKNALLNASNSYLNGKYVQVIDDLKSVDMKYLDKYQKYILAVSYVKSESLTPEQKENILETIIIDGEEKIKDYWIYLGRLNTAEAENLAMQCSDDELLLYAYMTEKAILEKNTEISGEEKNSRLEDLEKKIEELAKQYEQIEEEN